MTKTPTGKIFITQDLVKYQTGAVVSRTLIKKPGGSVTVFAFDAGESLSEHAVPFEALVEVIDGEAEIVLSGKKLTIRFGESLIMPAKAPHSVAAKKRFIMLLTLYRSS